MKTGSRARLRRHRADQRLRYDVAQHYGRPQQRQLRHQRAEDLDSRAEHSDLMLVLARTTPREHAARRTDRLSIFILDLQEAKARGLTIRPIRTMMNHSTTAVFFDNVEGRRRTSSARKAGGFAVFSRGSTRSGYSSPPSASGTENGFIDKATAYARERVVFGRPIGQNQGIQFPIAEAWAHMRAAELMVDRAAELYQRAADCGPEANMAKLLAADAAWEATEARVQTFGGAFGLVGRHTLLSRRR